MALYLGTTSYGSLYVGAAGGTVNNQDKTVSPTESQQVVTFDSQDGYTGLGEVTVNAISSTYVGSGIDRWSSSDLSASGATVTAPAGYYQNAATKTISNGSVTAPATISGTSASVSTGTNTLTLSKTVSVTPNVTSAGYISSGTAGNASVSLTASVTTQGAQTIHPSTSNQTIASGRYLTGAQTINAVTTTNLLAENIKSGVVVKVGDSSDDDCVASVTGTYSGGGGGSSMQVATSSSTLVSASSSISFTGLSGEPTSFAVVSSGTLNTGASPWKTASVVYDGTSVIGQYITNTSNAQVSYDGSAFSKSYSSGTLTITGTGSNFQTTEYLLVYTYGGTAANIGTEDVQVGSGATSITFTGLSEEPSYFSCIFKSNFSTSSGYQRVIAVVYDGTDVYGMEMDSSAKYSDAHWSYSYSSGSLTITSSGTNAGGYFHQPGYYQLTYATGADDTLQTKTVTPTTSVQNVTADTAQGYTALKKVVVNAIPSEYIIPSGNFPITSNGNNIDVAQYSTVSVNVPSGGSGWSVDTKTVSGGSSYPVSLDFTSMEGKPKAFFLRTTSQISSSGNTTYYYIVDMRYDGTSTTGNCFRIGGTRRVDNITSGYSFSYSGTTLTITSSAASRSASPGAFYSGNYELVYFY